MCALSVDWQTLFSCITVPIDRIWRFSRTATDAVGNNAAMAHSQADLLTCLRDFIRDEQHAATQQLLRVWARPLAEKLVTGLSQAFRRLERADDAGCLWAHIDPSANDSRFREGDLMVLHSGSPIESPLGRGFSLETEEDGRWLLRGTRASSVSSVFDGYGGGPAFGDPDSIDLTHYYERSLDDISISRIGRDVVLPLLNGHLAITFNGVDVAEGEKVALAEGFNARQAMAVGIAFGADQVACIQGPPGTGKTRVLALIARLLTGRGARILLTSHTHMAINNALNKIHALGVPTVKIGGGTQQKGLYGDVPVCPNLNAWHARPTNGYVVGATPFATCSPRLDGFDFDTIIFDEASQITVPLAIMAMRKGRRFIFVGDQKQLPPIMLSRSILSRDCLAVFTTLTAIDADHTVMLNETYRMNRWLAAWPSATYYDGKLTATGVNYERRLTLTHVDEKFKAVFDPEACGIFIPTRDTSARTHNFHDARLVVELCEAAVAGGLQLSDIGIVTPYRTQGRAIRNLLSRRFGRAAARDVIADTVERMQGQERELIILSLATGDEVFLGNIAGFFFQPERLNVAITRAMTKLIVIGPALASLPTLPALDALPALPALEGETIQRWVAQYRGLIGQLTRVDL
jgi:DNA replication ATP-dependent helicase Dna2